VGIELTEVILILGVFFGSIIGGLYYKSTQSGVKKAQKKNQISIFDNLTQYREVEKGTITDILKQKDNQIKSLNARLKQLEPQEEEEPTSKGVTFEEIQVLVKEVAPQYATFLPLMKKQIMEMTKGMTTQELLTYVKQFTGSKESKGNADPQSAEYNPNWA